MASSARMLNTVYRMAVPAALVGTAVSQSIFDVKGGTRAVIFDRLAGVKEDVINEGTHFLVPWLQRSVIFDVRTKPRNVATTTGTKDLQMVSLTLRVLHRPVVKSLPKIYQVRKLPTKFYCLFSSQSLTLLFNRTSAPTTMSESSPPSETKSSRPSSPSLMPPNSLPSERPSPSASAAS